MSRTAFWLVFVAAACLTAAVISARFIPANDCVYVGQPGPIANDLSLWALGIAALFGLGGVIQILIDGRGKLKAFAYATVITVLLVGGGLGITALAAVGSTNGSVPARSCPSG